MDATDAMNGNEPLPTTAAATETSTAASVALPHAVMELVDKEFVQAIPRDFARAHLLISQGTRDGVEVLYVSKKSSKAAAWNTGVLLKRPVTTTLADPESIAKAIDDAYGAAGIKTPEHDHSSDDKTSSENVDDLIARADRDLLSADGKGPIVKLVDALLFEALSRQASDVHVQPLDSRAIVRYRIDGMLITVRELPRALSPAVVSRIKVMGRMDIAESRIPQDGRASVTIGDRSIDLRLSTLPTSYGERAVVRLLDSGKKLFDFKTLGMPDDVAARFLDRASRAHGMLLLTGPTGSGKTTTLYATLNEIGSPSLNVMTIEDPIEYELSTVGIAISQAQVNEKKGVTFATGLRHILRQDPDVIMVGEIRDAETARIAIQSSLTGHLVFSTLHTNDAPSALSRLIDLGVEPYLVSASLSAVCAQRLVRMLHAPCSGKGCPQCFHTGFKGRIGVFELLVVDDAIRDLITRNAPIHEIRDAARAGGLRTLREEGLLMVERGLTTRAEVERVVQGVE